MESLLPSEIARLVYGYLKDEGCHEAAEKFMTTSDNMTEWQKLKTSGRRFRTHVLGCNLVQMLDQLSNVHSLVQNHVDNMPKELVRGTLLDQLNHLLKGNSQSKDGSCLGTVPNAVLNAKGEKESNSQMGLLPRLRAAVQENPEVNATCEDYYNALNFAVYNNPDFHEKLAENINKMRATREKTPDTIAKSVIKDQGFGVLLDEIIETATIFDKKEDEATKENRCVVEEIVPSNGSVEPATNERTKGKRTKDNLLERTQLNKENTESPMSIEDENAAAVQSILESIPNQNSLRENDDAHCADLNRSKFSNGVCDISVSKDMDKSILEEAMFGCVNSSDGRDSKNVSGDEPKLVNDSFSNKTYDKPLDQLKDKSNELNSNPKIVNNLPSGPDYVDSLLPSQSPNYFNSAKNIACSSVMTIMPLTRTPAVTSTPDTVLLVCTDKLSAPLSSTTIISSGSNLLETVNGALSSSSRVHLDTVVPNHGIHIQAHNKVVKTKLRKLCPKNTVSYPVSKLEVGKKEVLPNGISYMVMSPDIPSEAQNSQKTQEDEISDLKSCEPTKVANRTRPKSEEKGCSVNCSDTLGDCTESLTSKIVTEHDSDLTTNKSNLLVDISKNSDKTVDENSDHNEQISISGVSVEQTRNEDSRTELFKKGTEEKTSGSNKNKTPCERRSIKKRKSLSTPRRGSHVRSLDFTTPQKHISVRMIKTSPKVRYSPRFQHFKKVRSGLFRSPTKKLNASSKKLPENPEEHVQKGNSCQEKSKSNCREVPVAIKSPHAKLVDNRNAGVDLRDQKTISGNTWDKDLRALISEPKDTKFSQKQHCESRRRRIYKKHTKITNKTLTKIDDVDEHNLSNYGKKSQIKRKTHSKVSNNIESEEEENIKVQGMKGNDEQGKILVMGRKSATASNNVKDVSRNSVLNNTVSKKLSGKDVSMPALETPMKTNIPFMPQTPVLNTPMLKSIREETSVIGSEELLTPSFRPTPYKLNSEKKCLVQTLSPSKLMVNKSAEKLRYKSIGNVPKCKQVKETTPKNRKTHNVKQNNQTVTKSVLKNMNQKDKVKNSGKTDELISKFMKQVITELELKEEIFGSESESEDEFKKSPVRGSNLDSYRINYPENSDSSDDSSLDIKVNSKNSNNQHSMLSSSTCTEKGRISKDSPKMKNNFNKNKKHLNSLKHSSTNSNQSDSSSDADSSFTVQKNENSKKSSNISNRSSSNTEINVNSFKTPEKDPKGERKRKKIPTERKNASVVPLNSPKNMDKPKNSSSSGENDSNDADFSSMTSKNEKFVYVSNKRSSISELNVNPLNTPKKDKKIKDMVKQKDVKNIPTEKTTASLDIIKSSGKLENMENPKESENPISKVEVIPPKKKYVKTILLSSVPSLAKMPRQSLAKFAYTKSDCGSDNAQRVAASEEKVKTQLLEKRERLLNKLKESMSPIPSKTKNNHTVVTPASSLNCEKSKQPNIIDTNVKLDNKQFSNSDVDFNSSKLLLDLQAEYTTLEPLKTSTPYVNKISKVTKKEKNVNIRRHFPFEKQWTREMLSPVEDKKVTKRSNLEQNISCIMPKSNAVPENLTIPQKCINKKHLDNESLVRNDATASKICENQMYNQNFSNVEHGEPSKNVSLTCNEFYFHITHDENSAVPLHTYEFKNEIISQSFFDNDIQGRPFETKLFAAPMITLYEYIPFSARGIPDHERCDDRENKSKDYSIKSPKDEYDIGKRKDKYNLKGCSVILENYNVSDRRKEPYNKSLARETMKPLERRTRNDMIRRTKYTARKDEYRRNRLHSSQELYSSSSSPSRRDSKYKDIYRGKPRFISKTNEERRNTDNSRSKTAHSKSERSRDKQITYSDYYKRNRNKDRGKDRSPQYSRSYRKSSTLPHRHKKHETAKENVTCSDDSDLSSHETSQQVTKNLRPDSSQKLRERGKIARKSKVPPKSSKPSLNNDEILSPEEGEITEESEDDELNSTTVSQPSQFSTYLREDYSRDSMHRKVQLGKRPASKEDPYEVSEKKTKTDDEAQKLLKKMDSEHLEQFLSVVHPEARK